MAKKHLVIVESPAKAKTIGKYLGKDYEVKASMGHLRDLPKSKLGVDIEHDFEPVYQPIRGKEELISELKKAAKSSDTVYLATDPDREGEAISWHLKALLNLDDEKAKRVTFNEITKKVVSESIKEPRAIDQDLVDAQQARRVLDRIVGYQLSPLLWKKVRRGFWTVCTAMSCPRCCGARSVRACPRAACSPSLCAWSTTAKRKFRPSRRRNTGHLTPTSPTRRRTRPLRRTITARTVKRSSRPPASRWTASLPTSATRPLL